MSDWRDERKCIPLNVKSTSQEEGDKMKSSTLDQSSVANCLLIFRKVGLERTTGDKESSPCYIRKSLFEVLLVTRKKVNWGGGGREME